MGSSQVMGPRGASTGDLELPAPSIIPVAYVLYSNKMEFGFFIFCPNCYSLKLTAKFLPWITCTLAH